ncbi:MAG: fibronectin type III domain-containing protein, partial [Candidatus Cloacimonetes bacterium]|nr:fibronectin type III domain-containing protein [Candidatus Cloacimonadota bacterium]
MKRIALVLLGLILCSSVFSYITETASFKDFLLWEEPACEYDKWISHIVEGIASANYNLYAPYDRQTNGFGNFRVASTTELTDWGLVIDAFLMGELDTAQTLIDLYDFPYQVVHFTDLDTGRTYYMLREIPSDMYYDDNGTADPYDDEVGGFRYGWGLYVYNPMSTRPLIVTVPHPTDDYPSSAIGYEGFTYWDAKFLFVAGAGREVVWTNVGSYTNAKSISDPTRYANHPFNVAYNKSCDLIRTEFSQRELSVQMHTYDWNRHVGAAHVQIAAGYGRPCPNLPIRDLSDLKLDVINQGSNLMIPANTYGVHDDVYLNDFYTVYYNTHAFTFEDGDVSYPVNNYVTLTGAENNRQQVYSVSGITDYDSFEPFFHIEMDELPYCYDETQNNFKWFYGWEESSQRWDFSALFNNFVSFYKRWIVDLDGILDPLFTMNDGLPPTDPSNLIVHNQSLNYITLRWLPSSAYDFHSYEILYATEPIGLDNYQIFSRDNNNYLASQAATQVNVTGLSNSNTYYFRIRAVDKNGNYSNLSNEVVTIPAPANVTAFNTYGMDNSILCTWTVSGQSNNQGFKIYRKLDDTDFELIDSYASNPELSNPNNSYTMQYWDNNVLNGVTYTYQICAVNGNDQEFIYNVPSSTSPRRIHSISVMNQSETLVNTLTFGNNP